MANTSLLKLATFQDVPLTQVDADNLLVGPPPSKELIASVKDYGGNIEPVWLHPSDLPDLYNVVAGTRRIKAARVAGLTNIRAQVFPKWVSVPELAILENWMRGNNDARDAYMLELLGADRTEQELTKLAATCGMKAANVKFAKKWKNLNPCLKDLVYSGRMAQDTWPKATELKPEQQVQLYDAWQAQDAEKPGRARITPKDVRLITVVGRNGAVADFCNLMDLATQDGEGLTWRDRAADALNSFLKEVPATEEAWLTWTEIGLALLKAGANPELAHA